MMKLLSLFLIAIVFIQVFVEAASVSDATNEDSRGNLPSLFKKPYHPKINCNYACARRCIKASRKKICLRACKSCCARCHCVPPGTYGNKNMCPCYARLTTHGNKPKCP